MPMKGQKGRYNYGRAFDYPGSRIKVQYRYKNRVKSTKTLVWADTKKPVRK